MSWHSFKSFTPYEVTAFEEILKRSGKFLKRLSIKDMNEGDSETILNTIADECTNLQSIDMGDYQVTKDFIKLFKPNFKKVEEFLCETERMNDEDLNNLFSENNKLRHLKINAFEGQRLRGKFLQALSRESLTHLELCNIEIDGLNLIQDFNLLKSLTLEEIFVTDDVLINVAKCLELNCVKLFGKLFNIFDAANIIYQIFSMMNFFPGCSITDRGLIALSKLPKLKELCVALYKI